jgi:hypothetical protein
MKQSVIKVTTCAFIISAITLFYTHQDVCGKELNRFTSFCREDELTEHDIDGDGDGGSVNYSSGYATNSNQYSNDNNSNETSITKDNDAFTKTAIPQESIVYNTVSNENSKNNTVAYNENYSSKEYGANNNYPDVNSEYNPGMEASAASQSEHTKSYSSINLSKEIDLSSKEILTNIGSSSAPPPPGDGGGEDPFSAPLDDFYGLAFLLLASTVFGIFGMKKMKMG